MATYKIKQLKSENVSGIAASSVSSTVAAVQTIDLFGIDAHYYDLGFYDSSSVHFSPQYIYYMDLKIKKVYNNLYNETDTNRRLNIQMLAGSLEKIKDNSAELIDTFTINPATVATTADAQYFYYNTIFSPTEKSDYLVLRINKEAFDVVDNTYRTWLINGDNSEGLQPGPGVDFSTVAIGNFASTVASSNYGSINTPVECKFYTLNNILGENISAKKIGFQSRPATLIAVNKQSIRVGRSGIFEIYNGIDVTDIRIAPNSNGEIDQFLLDYIYQVQQS